MSLDSQKEVKMYHKCEIEFIYKPKGIFTSSEAFHSALRKFFLQEGYTMERVATEEENEYMFTICPVEEKIEPKVIRIPSPSKK